jgi:hypothetical protein
MTERYYYTKPDVDDAHIAGFTEGWKLGYDAGLADAENLIAERRWKINDAEPKPDGFLGAPK